MTEHIGGCSQLAQIVTPAASTAGATRIGRGQPQTRAGRVASAVLRVAIH